MKQTTYYFHLFVKLTGLLGILMYSTTATYAAEAQNKTNESRQVIMNDDGIQKSKIDERQYRIIELSNQLKVMLVSDANADKAAVSLDVSVGSGSDPEDAQGLAHFLEHMLFLGNEKFPEPGEYQEFIQQHGGSTNAFTAYDQTNYFFDINRDYLEPAIDRFAQFFISPLFNQEYAERERSIVHSEYNARRTNEYRRIFSARKSIFNAEHPITKFSIGNNETLADVESENVAGDKQSIREKLIAFYNDYYSASIMAVTIIGHQSLDELESLADKYFSPIKNNGFEVPLLSMPLYTEGALPKLLYVNPLKDQSSLTLSFPMPEVESMYRVKPTYYLSNLLGHEGRGSLLSYLKEQGWALSLSAGLELSHREESSFAVNINLTDNGMKNWQSVVESFYQYVAMIKVDSDENKTQSKRIYNEQASIAALDFDYQRRSENADYAVSISHQLKNYPAAEVLSAPALMEQFDFDVIQRYLGFINPNNMLAILVDKTLPSNATSQYYDANYQINDFDNDWLVTLSDMANSAKTTKFSLPEDNIFIAEDTRMVDSNQDDSTGLIKPKKIIEQTGFQYWHQTDTSFGAPRSNLYLSIRSPIIGASAESQVLNQLYTRVVNETLNEYLYPAYLADLNVSIYPHLRGLTVRMGGFNDKQDLLLQPVFEALFNQSIDQTLFLRKKEEIIRQYKDADFEMPYQSLYGRGSDVFMKNSWPTELKLAIIDAIDYQDLEAFRQEFTKSMDIVVLNHGNVSEENALKNGQLILTQLPKELNFINVEHTKIADLNQAKNYLNLLKVSHEDNAVMVVTQSQQSSVLEKAKMYVLYQMIDSAFYHELRTVQQLGYIVSSNPYSSLEYPGLGLIVESSSHSEVQIYQAINDFMKSIPTKVKSVDTAQYEVLKKGLISKINKRDDNLEERTNRLWHELDRENFEFDSREKLIEAIKQLDKETIELFASSVFDEKRSPDDYARLVLVTQHDDDNVAALTEELTQLNNDWQIIESIESFKNSVDYH